jgi:hypothetical protein
MAEYIELNELQEFCRKYTEVDAISLILAGRTDLLHTANVVERSEYEKLKIENNELKIKYADAEKRFCNAMDKNVKLRSKLDKAIEKIFFLRQHKPKYVTEDRKICIDSGEVLKILDECTEE